MIQVSRRALQRTVVVALSIVSLLILAAGGSGYWLLRSSLPLLEGTMALSRLSGPVTVSRDQQGVPTISGANRADLARVLGFLHGQERFFQMDGQRRTAAGELSDLAGPIA